MSERSGIESSLGKVSYSSGTKKVLTVDDPTMEKSTRSFSSGNFEDERLNEQFTEEELDELAANRERLTQSRKQGQEQRNRIPDGVKRRLEILAGIGRLTEDVVVDGVTFSIRSLKPKETKEVVELMINKNTQVEQALIHRTQTMARALYKIDGLSIDSVLDSSDINVKVQFIEEVLEESLVNFLLNKYQSLIELNKKKFTDLGKTEEEVLENVKKS